MSSPLLKNKTYNKVITCFLISIAFSGCSTWSPDYEYAHPNAQVLLKDDFFWDQTNSFAPFGNDDGNDAIYEYHNWTKLNPQKESTEFLNYLFNKWNYTLYDYTKTDTAIIRQFINSSRIGDRLFYGIDDVIIATGFGEFIIRGTIGAKMKSLTLLALQRQLLPISLATIDAEYRDERIKSLKKMIEVINATS